MHSTVLFCSFFWLFLILFYSLLSCHCVVVHLLLFQLSGFCFYSVCVLARMRERETEMLANKIVDA